MKNLHYLKKFVVMVLAAMMTLSTFAMPTFAASTAQFTVTGIDGAAEATAYKIVSISEGADKGSAKLVLAKNKANDASSIADVQKPTYSEIMELATRTAELSSATTGKVIAGTVSGDTATFANADPGMYLVIINSKDNADVIYNPVVVSVNLKKNADNTLGDAENSSFAVGDDTVYDYPEGTAQVKKSPVDFKKVVDRDGAKNGGNDSNVDNPKTTGDEASYNGTDTFAENGDTAGTKGNGTAKVGDTVWFRINTAFPAYADNFFNKDKDGKYVDTDTFKNPQFEVHDKLSNGLTLLPGTDDKDIKVFVGTPLAPMDEKYYTITSEVGDDKEDNFKVVFTAEALDLYGGQNIELRYAAKVNGDHGCNFDAETNTGEVKYTRNPGKDKKDGKKETTFHYTFTINGKIDGNGSADNREVIKVGVDSSGNQVFRETTWTTETGWKPLEGVKFNLYKKIDGATTAAAYEGKEVIKVATSDADGVLKGMDQLDAGKYALVETDLGTNTQYAKNTTPIDIEIAAQLDTKGRLASYQVKVNDIIVGNYKKVYDDDTDTPLDGTIQYLNDAGEVVNTHHEVQYNDGTKVHEYIDNDTEAADIRNSKVGTLPSTGGMGTVLFTIGGAAIMALAIFLLFGGKKKQHQK